MDRVIGFTEMRSHLREVLEETAKGARYIIASRSKPKAVLVSLEELETLAVMADRELLEEIKEAKEDIKAGRYVALDEYFEEP